MRNLVCISVERKVVWPVAYKDFDVYDILDMSDDELRQHFEILGDETKGLGKAQLQKS